MKITKKMVGLYLLSLSEEEFRVSVVREAVENVVSFRMPEQELAMLENK